MDLDGWFHQGAIRCDEVWHLHGYLSKRVDTRVEWISWKFILTVSLAHMLEGAYLEGHFTHNQSLMMWGGVHLTLTLSEGMCECLRPATVLLPQSNSKFCILIWWAMWSKPPMEHCWLSLMDMELRNISLWLCVEKKEIPFLRDDKECYGSYNPAGLVQMDCTADELQLSHVQAWHCLW